MDHYIYDILGYKLYVRYMDDFLIFVETKEEAKKIMSKVEKFIRNNLNLKLNEKSIYFKNRLGVNFCGYRIFEDYKLLRNRYKKKVKKSIKKWNNLNNINKLGEKHKTSWKSLKAHAKHCCSKRYLEKIYKENIVLSFLE